MATGGADTLQRLTAEDRRAVETAVADNVLEGWEPSPADVGRLAQLAAGDITFDEYRASIGETAQRR